jgi:hypothetical protein
MCCTPDELIVYVNDNERGFVYGTDGLQLDHVRPLASFGDSMRCPAVQLEAFCYINLQLLPDTENYSKHDKYTKKDAEIYEASERGLAIADQRVIWRAEKICPGCEWCP